jgi:hypothetical protein
MLKDTSRMLLGTRTELDSIPSAMVSVLSADPSQSHSYRWIIDMPKV